MVEVEPEAEALSHLAPLVDVPVGRLLAQRVEPIDAILLDLLLPADLQRALDLELDREPVRIPARLALHREPGHLLVARENILVRARDHMVETGQTVRGGRSLVEDEGRCVSAPVQRALEYAIVPPELENLHLRFCEAGAAGHRRIPGHGGQGYRQTGGLPVSSQHVFTAPAGPPARKRKWSGRCEPSSHPPPLRPRSHRSCPCSTRAAASHMLAPAGRAGA